jgi:methylated-DNA-protein-cysteine methyltransferase related protein
MSSELYSQIYELIRQIPEGKVATYGQLAGFLRRGSARQVGFALAATPKGVNIPWQRVINAKGEVSERTGDGEGASTQKKMLLAEGVFFNTAGRVDFKRCGWQGPDWEWLEANEYKVYPD